MPLAGCNMFLCCLLSHNPAAAGGTLGSGAQSPSKLDGATGGAGYSFFLIFDLL